MRIGSRFATSLGRATVALGLLGAIVFTLSTTDNAQGYRAITDADANAVTGGQTGCSNFTAQPILCVGGKCSPCPSFVKWNPTGNVSLKNVTTSPQTCFNCGSICNTVTCSQAAFCMAPGRATYDLADIAVHSHDAQGL